MAVDVYLFDWTSTKCVVVAAAVVVAVAVAAQESVLPPIKISEPPFGQSVRTCKGSCRPPRTAGSSDFQGMRYPSWELTYSCPRYV